MARRHWLVCAGLLLQSEEQAERRRSSRSGKSFLVLSCLVLSRLGLLGLGIGLGIDLGLGLACE